MVSHLSRNEFLRATGAALVAGLAGCNSPSADASPSTDATAAQSSTSSSAPAVGQFYVGDADAGTDGVVDGRAEVVSVRPETATAKTPVVMVPGLGLSPYIYLATPDGRAGWVERFVDAGHPVYVFNPPRNVDSGGLDTAALENTGTASLSTWSIDRAWPTWGFGPEVGTPYDDVRYPVEAVDQLVASFPAYVNTGGRGGGGSRFASPAETTALAALLERVGPATLLVHSAGGGSGFAVAQSRPDLVDRIVAVEPVGCPTDPQTVSRMGGDAPFLGVYGDYVAERGQTGRKSACRTTAELAGETNPASTMLSLPAEGVSGNTHLMMQDDNNGAIADRIRSWIDE
jgi:pimeloyl-ACP methyl ester carboxylesterase